MRMFSKFLISSRIAWGDMLNVNIHISVNFKKTIIQALYVNVFQISKLSNRSKQQYTFSPPIEPITGKCNGYRI